MIGERLTFSLYVTVLGLAVVFVVLIILMFLAGLTKYVNLIPTREDIKKGRKKKKSEQLAPVAAPAEQPPIAPAPVVASAIGEAELAAVISAAVAAYMAMEPTAGLNGIVVRSVRRTNSFSAASRYERINNRI